MTDLATAVTTAMTTRNVPAGELSPVHHEAPKRTIEHLCSGAAAVIWGLLAPGRDVIPYPIFGRCMHRSETVVRLLRKDVFYLNF